MSANPKYREQVAALANGDSSKANQLNEALTDDERVEFQNFLGATFAVMLEHYFKDDLSRDAVAKFVDEMRQELEGTGTPIGAWALEGVIRASCGEEHLFEELSGQDVLGTYILVVSKLGQQDDEISANLDQFLDDAVELAEEWKEEDS